LLEPRDYGVWGMLVVALGTVLFLRQAGIGDKFVQQDEPDQELAFQKAFTLELAFNGLFALVLAAVVPIAALVYGRGEMVAPGLALIVLLPAAALQAPLWIHYRRMDFARQRTLQAVEPVVGFLVAIALALAGAGYWSFVVAIVAGAWTTSALAVWTSPHPLRLRYERGTLRTYVTFSWPLLVAGGGALAPRLQLGRLLPRARRDAPARRLRARGLPRLPGGRAAAALALRPRRPRGRPRPRRGDQRRLPRLVPAAAVPRVSDDRPRGAGHRADRARRGRRAPAAGGRGGPARRRRRGRRAGPLRGGDGRRHAAPGACAGARDGRLPARRTLSNSPANAQQRLRAAGKGGGRPPTREEPPHVLPASSRRPRRHHPHPRDRRARRRRAHPPARRAGQVHRDALPRLDVRRPDRRLPGRRR